MNFEAQAAAGVREALAGAEQAIMVESGPQLQQAAERWRACPVMGLDTEFVRERTYRADLGLVQVSDGQTAWLIDPLKIDEPGPLNALLTETSCLKVIHSGSEDFEVLYHQLGVSPATVMDSQIACAMLGQSLQLGYHHAVSWLFDVEIEKDQTRSNWLKRPLTGAQCRYAALDVVLLPMMAEQLREQLVALGRWEWLAEEVERMARKSQEETDPGSAWQRIRGAGSLGDLERKMLRSLAEWREETALSKNLARGFVVKDASLLAMTREKPRTIEALGEIEGLHPRAVARYGTKWLELMNSAEDAPEVEPLPQLDYSHKAVMNAMRKKVSSVAGGLNVDAALLASKKQLEQLILEYEASGEIPERFCGWRKDVITNDLLAILDRY